MSLNPLQQNAKDGLMKFVVDKEHSFALLLGPAGSGKTYTLSHIIQEAKALGREVVAATPTHKAKSVLLETLERYNLTVPASTVSALIGKAPTTTDAPDDEGNAQWAYGGGSTIPPGSLLIVDELSMISAIDMRSLKKVVDAAGAQAILVGDFAQLRPVKGHSIKDAVEKIPVRFQLSEVMRSGSQGIVAMSKSVRTTGELDLDSVDNQTVFIHNSTDDFERAFRDTPGAVAIAYTNRRVSELNKIKRLAIYGEGLRDFMPQEQVILTEAPFFSRGIGPSGGYENFKVADNNSVLEVVRCGDLRQFKNPFSEREIPYYDMVLLNPETSLEFEAKGLTYDMYVNHLDPALKEVLATLREFSDRLGKLDEQLRARFDRGGIEPREKNYITPTQVHKFFTKAQADWILTTAKTNPKFIGMTFSLDDAEEKVYSMKGNWASLRRLMWARDYFGFRGQFAVLLYEHASTAHKAQGSTYTHTYVDWPNLETIRDEDDRQAACYVAVSRASETLHIRV
jgi:hypothetical protein